MYTRDQYPENAPLPYDVMIRLVKEGTRFHHWFDPVEKAVYAIHDDDVARWRGEDVVPLDLPSRIVRVEPDLEPEADAPKVEVQDVEGEPQPTHIIAGTPVVAVRGRDNVVRYMELNRDGSKGKQVSAKDKRVLELDGERFKWPDVGGGDDDSE